MDRSNLRSFCAFTGASGPTCFLAICGNSGCGKTSTVQQVCAENNVHILEWSEDLWDAESAGSKNTWADGSDFDATSSGRVVNSNYTRNYEAQYGGGYSNTAQDLFKVEGVTWAAYTSKVKLYFIVYLGVRSYLLLQYIASEMRLAHQLTFSNISHYFLPHCSLIIG